MKYECKICGHEYNIIQGKDIQATTTCPECGEIQEVHENSR